MGQLKFEIHTVGDAVVCRITGDLHIDTLPEAKSVLDAVAAPLPRLLCVDLRDARLYDTTGLRLARRLPLALINPGSQVLRVLQLSLTFNLGGLGVP